MKRVLCILLALGLLLGCRGEIAAMEPAATPAPTTPAATVGPTRNLAVAAPTPGPTVTPLPSPTPTVSPTPTPAPTLDPDRPMIALTFDDGPTEYTDQVLDLLERYGAKGTFFVIGSSLSDKTRPILQRMADMGCDIGSHDLTHANLTRFSAAANRKRIEKMRARISAQIEGGYEIRLLRPPYGSVNKALRRACQEGQVACIRWSVDTRDWSNKSPKTILKIVKREAKDGAIILFHDRLPTTVTALKDVIPYLVEEGYDLVTVTELIESSGQSLVWGADYHKKPGR